MFGGSSNVSPFRTTAVVCALLVVLLSAPVSPKISSSFVRGYKAAMARVYANQVYKSYFESNKISNNKDGRSNGANVTVSVNQTVNTTNNTSSSNTNNKEGENIEIGKQVMVLLNEYRDSLGLSQLTWSDKAYALAVPHTVYMVDKQKISHDNFDDRAKGWGSINENVAMFTGGVDSDAAQKFFTMWKNSPGHDANMRSKSVNKDAVSVYYDKTKRAYYSTMINVKE